MLQGLWVYVETWWIYVLFGSLQFVLRYGISFAYQRARDWLDRRHPDDLPLHAGDWLTERIGEMGIEGLLVAVAPEKQEQMDAYLPSADLILLTPTTYTKRDASYWAVAAHELGHALADRSSRVYAVVTYGARAWLGSLVGLASSILVANMFYRLPVLNRIAFAMFFASLFCDVVVMCDEARASLIARRTLASDPRFAAPLLRTATWTLLVAFGTYVGAFLGRVILLERWDMVIASVEHHIVYTPAPPVSGGALVLVAALSLALILMATRSLVLVFRRRHLEGHPLASETVCGFLVAALLYVVWDQPLGPVFVASCIAATYSTRLALVVALLPLIVPLVLLTVIAVLIGIAIVLRIPRLRSALASPPESGTSAENAPPARPLHAAERMVADLNYGAAMARAGRVLSLRHLVQQCVSPVACVPLIIAFWVMR